MNRLFGVAVVFVVALGVLVPVVKRIRKWLSS
jgi:hypothetical protein